MKCRNTSKSQEITHRYIVFNKCRQWLNENVSDKSVEKQMTVSAKEDNRNRLLWQRKGKKDPPDYVWYRSWSTYHRPLFFKALNCSIFTTGQTNKELSSCPEISRAVGAKTNHALQATECARTPVLRFTVVSGQHFKGLTWLVPVAVFRNQPQSL